MTVFRLEHRYATEKNLCLTVFNRLNKVCKIMARKVLGNIASKFGNGKQE